MRIVLIIFASVALASLANAATVSLEFRHIWKDEPLPVPSGEIRTSAGEEIRITRLSYLLSDVLLKPSNSNEENRFAFVDADATTVTNFYLGNIENGEYSELQFHVGLDAETDNADPSQFGPTHPLNPVVNNLHRTLPRGYTFLSLEGRTGESGFSYQLGTPRNRVLVSLPLKLKLEDSARVVVDFHLDRLLDKLKTQDQSSTHSREGDPLAEKLQQLLVGAFSIREVQIGAEGQKATAAPGISQIGEAYEFKSIPGFPAPDLPADFPLTNERVALGKELFHEPGLSRTFDISCATCHSYAAGFSDNDRFSFGVDRRTGTRQSMTLFNLAWKEEFFWDGRAGSLREQALMPIQDHLEMDEKLENVVRKVGRRRNYQRLFETAFGDPEVTPERIGIAIEQFVMTLTSGDSKFDRAMRGEEQLTELEQRGFELFNTEFDPKREIRGAGCFHCHGGPFFTDYKFHDNGLKPTEVNDIGRAKVTEKETDAYKFSTPTLRNIAITQPYMHDGRFATLEEAVAHYAGGVHRNPNLNPNLARHPDGGIPLSEKDQEALVAFLKTLTDKQYDWMKK